ncbi:MAG: MurR/RpiR family transcriptional regulator [Ruminococcaceae bacterium]|nr:MurR/RpiR family transcriptional regulator [Oscillospiraceae bacterium]
MEAAVDIITKIKDNYSDLSKGHKKIADYVLSKYDKAAYLNASALAAEVGISESTVVRFAYELGCDGFASFQRALQEIIPNKLTSVQRMDVTTSRMGDKDILTTVMQADLEKIKQTLEDTDRSEFSGAVDTILNAESVYILGVRSAASIAQFVYYYTTLLLPNVKLLHTSSSSEIFEQLIRTDKKTVVIAISFPRYSKRTLKAVQFASSRGSKIITIADSPYAPINEYATHKLIARSDMASFVDSLVAPLSLVNSLIVAIGMRKKDEVKNTFEQLERIWDEYEVYEKSDGKHDEH